MTDNRGGQSLIEIIVAVAVGVILIMGALLIITPTLKTSSDVTRIQVASGLGKELLDETRAVSEMNWHTLDSLATSSANTYYIIASTSPFTVATGTENVAVGTTTYSRYFYLDYAYRNTSDKIDAAGTVFDPSTRKVTVVYTWPPSGTGSFTSYLTRVHNEAFVQTDWSGGSGQEGPITATSVNAMYSTSSGIDNTTSSGSIVIQGF